MGKKRKVLKRRMLSTFLAVLLCLASVLELPAFRTTAHAAGSIRYVIAITGGTGGFVESPEDEPTAYAERPTYAAGQYLKMREGELGKYEAFDYWKVTVAYVWGSGKQQKSYSFTENFSENVIPPIEALAQEKLAQWDLVEAAYRSGTTIHAVVGVELVTKANYYSVTFDANGAEGSISSKRVIIGQQFTLPECSFTYEHYEFAGWKIGDEIYQPGTKYRPTADTVVQAQWNPVNYEITLLLDSVLSGTSWGQVTGGGSHPYGEEITVSAKRAKISDTVDVALKAWYENGQVVSTDEDYTFTVTGDRTLTAKYDYRFKVTFTSGYGEYESYTDESLPGSYVLPQCTFTRAGYNFVGWKNRGGSAQYPVDVYKPGTQFDNVASIPTVWDAQWEAFEATIYLLYAPFVDGAPDLTRAVAVPEGEGAPEGKEYFAKYVTSGTYVATDEDLDNGIVYIINDASVSLNRSGVQGIPDGWEMSGDSTIYFNNTGYANQKAYAISHAEDFPGFYVNIMDNPGAFVDFYTSYPYVDVQTETGTNWRHQYDYVIPGASFTVSNVIARAIYVNAGATLNLGPTYLWDENGQPETQSSGGMISTTHLVVDGTINVLPYEMEDRMPFIRIFESGTVISGSKAKYTGVTCELCLYPYVTCEGLTLYDRNEAGEIVPYALSENHGNESFFLDAKENKWIGNGYHSLDQKTFMLHYDEQYYDGVQHAAVLEHGKLMRHDEVKAFTVGQPLVFTLQPPDGRKNSTPVVIIRYGSFGDYREFTSYPEWDDRIILTKDEATGYYSFSFTPTTEWGMDVDVEWSEYDAYRGDDTYFVIMKRDSYSGEDESELTGTIEIKPTTMEGMDEPEGGKGRKLRYWRGLFNDGTELTVTFRPIDGYYVTEIQSDVEGDFYVYSDKAPTRPEDRMLTGSVFTKNADGTYSYTFTSAPERNDVQFKFHCEKMPGDVSLMTWGIATEYRIGTGSWKTYSGEDLEFTISRSEIGDAGKVTFRFTPKENERITGIGVLSRDGNNGEQYDKYHLDSDNCFTLNKGDGWKDYELEILTWDCALNGQYRFDLRDDNMPDYQVLNAQGRPYEYGVNYAIPADPIQFKFETDPYKVMVHIDRKENVPLEKTGDLYVYTPEGDAGVQFEIYATREAYEFFTTEPLYMQGQFSATYHVHVDTEHGENVGGTVTHDATPIKTAKYCDQTKLILQRVPEGQTYLIHLTITPNAYSEYQIWENGQEITARVMENGNVYEWNVTEPQMIPQVNIAFHPILRDVEIEGGSVSETRAYKGQIVDVRLGEVPAGMEFSRWEVVSGEVTIEHPTAAETHFVMGEKPVKIKATYVTKNLKGVMWSVSAAFKGMIELNFYCEVPEELTADPDAYVVMSKDGKEDVTMLIKAGTKTTIYGHPAYRFAYPVVAKEMRDKVTIHLYNGRGEEIPLKSGSGTEYGYNGCSLSIVDYCDMVLANSNEQKMIDLAKAVKDYGTAAQLYFGYNDANLSVSNRVKNVDKQAVIDAFYPVKEGEDPAGFTGMSMTLVYEASSACRVYFYYEDGVGAGRFAYTVDGNSKKVIKNSSGQSYLEVKNIAAKDLDDEHVFTISLGGKTRTIKVSAMSYAALLCANSVKNKPINLGKAMYLYNLAAKAYFNKN